MAIPISPLLLPSTPNTRRDLRGRRQSRRSILTHAAQDESGGAKPETKGKGVSRKASSMISIHSIEDNPVVLLRKLIRQSGLTLVTLWGRVCDYSLPTPTMNFLSKNH